MTIAAVMRKRGGPLHASLKCAAGIDTKRALAGKIGSFVVVDAEMETNRKCRRCWVDTGYDALMGD